MTIKLHYTLSKKVAILQSMNTHTFSPVKQLLSVNRDAKTIKSLKKGIITGILYLAPHNLSGFQVCPKASEGCKHGCIYTAGHGIYSSVQNSRINRTRWFYNDRPSFLETLVSNIESLCKKAKNEKLKVAIRLNGTSDIGWEKIACYRNGKKYASLMEAFPTIQFYDYSKILNRHKALALKNYHLTFSLSESNDREALTALAQGYNVAVVLNLSKNAKKPTTWSGYPVVDGDEYDIRSLDPKHGHIVALYAKGKARYDTLGFVRNISDSFKVD